MSAAASYVARKRPCLSCGETFLSEWSGHRLCNTCRGGAPERTRSDAVIDRADRAAKAAKLFLWLQAYQGDLPKLSGVAKAVPLPSHYDAWDALDYLRKAGRIMWRSGTRQANRGHQAVRMLDTGKVLKTAGCPFDPPGVEG